jgi:hypothetical protein
MKKTIILFTVCVLALSSCASGPKIASDGRAVTGGMPPFVLSAVKGTSRDVLVGVASARIGAAGLGQARTIAETRAAADIARKLNLIVKTAVTDVTASSEISPKDALSYQETINMSLSKSNLVGLTVIEEGRDGDNNYWVVAVLGKGEVAKEINQAQAAAKLAVPKAAALDAAARMDKAFEKIANEPVGVSSN